MTTYKHREIESAVFLGERVDFVAANDRIRNRVRNLSNERHVLNRLVSEMNQDEVFWDIGACLGIHSFILAKHMDQADIILFEPMHTNRAVAVDNKQVNELSNLEISRLALSDETGERKFQLRESLEAGYGRHSFSAGTDEYDYIREITVPTESGDNAEYSQPNVVKIDVEGASPLVLEGMEETLSNPACHTVILETHEPNPVQPSHEDFGYTREDIVNKLESFGFEVSPMEEEYHLYGTKKSDTGIDISGIEPDFSFVKGDISKSSVDCIVNSAGTSLRMGTGVAGALKEAGGNELYMDALESGPIDLGSAEATDAYNLNADIVVHAASMPHYGNGKSTPESIYNATRSAIDEAEENNAKSIAIPAIGCGLGGVSLTTGAVEILKALQDVEYDSIESIRFVLYTEDEYNTVKDIISEN